MPRLRMMNVGIHSWRREKMPKGFLGRMPQRRPDPWSSKSRTAVRTTSGYLVRKPLKPAVDADLHPQLLRQGIVQLPVCRQVPPSRSILPVWLMETPALFRSPKRIVHRLRQTQGSLVYRAEKSQTRTGKNTCPIVIQFKAVSDSRGVVIRCPAPSECVRRTVCNQCSFCKQGSGQSLVFSGKRMVGIRKRKYPARSQVHQIVTVRQNRYFFQSVGIANAGGDLIHANCFGRFVHNQANPGTPRLRATSIVTPVPS